MRIGLIAKALGAQLLLAFCVSSAFAAPCVNPPLSDAAVDQFKTNPQSSIPPDSDARTVEALVRDLAGTDASLAADIVKLAQGSNPRLQTAIAAGLAQAAVACQTIDQNAALLIQQAVAGFQDGEFQNAFAAVAGDLSTAAITAATNAATGAVGSVVVTNPNTGRGSTTNPGGGGTPVFFQITAAGVAIASTTANTPTNTTTAAAPVSATR